MCSPVHPQGGSAVQMSSVSFLVLAKCRFALGNQSVAFLIFTNACVLQGHLCSVFMLEMNIHRFFFVSVFADIIHLTFLTL